MERNYIVILMTIYFFSILKNHQKTIVVVIVSVVVVIRVKITQTVIIIIRIRTIII